MHGNEFSLQLNEATTSISNTDAYLICYVRFIDNDGNIVEDLLFCKPISTSSKAHELFAILDNFLRQIILRKYCVGLCSDDARAMSDCFVGQIATSVSAGRCSQRQIDPLPNSQ